jgi:uncharacterized OB-fold protein
VDWETQSEEDQQAAKIAQENLMAPMKCPVCGTEVAQKAAACPKCAYPFEVNTQRLSGGELFFIIVAAIVTAGILLFIASLIATITSSPFR